MDIVSRLKRFLQQNGIANSQFADNCQIPRPTLSQILNGRNKKVSDEVIAKIHHSYPSLNVMWLMFGDGEMFVPDANMDDVRQSKPAESGSNGGYVSGGRQNQNLRQQSSIDFEEDEASVAPSAVRQRASASSPSPDNADVMQAMLGMMGGSSSHPRKGDGSKRRVESIMVFYSDNSFEVFKPST